MTEEPSLGIRATFRRLWPYLSRYRGRAAWVVVLGVLAAAVGKANFVLLKPLANLLFAGEDSPLPTGVEPSTLDRLLEQCLTPLTEGLASTTQVVWTLVGLMIGVALLFAVLQYCFLRLSRMLSVWMVADLRQDLAEHVIGLGMGYHTDRRLGDLLSRLSADVTTSLRILSLVVEEVVQEPFHVAASLAIMFAVAPVPALALLAFVPIAILPVLRLGPRVRRKSKRSQDKLGDSTQALTQIFSGIRVVKAFRMEAREAERFRDENQAFVRQTDGMIRAQATGLATTMFLAQAGLAGAIGLVALLNINARIFTDSGSMLVFFVAAGAMYGSVKKLTKALTIVHSSLGATERVFAVLDEEPDEIEASDAVTIDGLHDAIRFEQVGFGYGGGEAPAVVDLSFTIERGQTVALVGPSGSGKTTTLDLVARFYDPTSGAITIDGIDLRRVRRSDWMGRIAVVSQQPFLFQTSIEENIRYGRPDATPEELREAVQAACLDEFVDGLPDGLATRVGAAGARLSGGQAQRVTIARAFLKSADLLLLDEATSALDSESEKRVQEAIDNLLAGSTALVIAHRLSTIRNADNILVLDGGRILEQGSHEDLVAADGLYARMWRIQGG